MHPQLDHIAPIRSRLHQDVSHPTFGRMLHELITQSNIDWTVNSEIFCDNKQEY